jgi:hypothetical protein
MRDRSCIHNLDDEDCYKCDIFLYTPVDCSMCNRWMDSNTYLKERKKNEQIEQRGNSTVSGSALDGDLC